MTNLVTRHPAVTASAAATLQIETEGRAVIGLGQGDSALSQIDEHRLPLARFEQTLTALQQLLRGEEAQLGGSVSTVHWLAAAPCAKVPVHVAATGPRTVAAAARHADGVDLSVGADLTRLRQGSVAARQAAPGDLSLGAYLNVAVDRDRAAAREQVRGSVAIFARFSAASASAAALSDANRRGIEQVASTYDRGHHGEVSAPHALALEDEFIDQFAVVGPAEEVRGRLVEIAQLGIERLIIVPGSLGVDPAALERSNARFAADVLPHLLVSGG